MNSEAPPLILSPGLAPCDTSEFRCSVCQRIFARREHLNRHMRKHTKETPFKCPTCEKQFSRADILQRHQNSHLASDTGKNLGATTSFRACTLCASTRVRCSGGAPCQRCLKKGTECKYPSQRKRREKSKERPKNYEPLGFSNGINQPTGALEISPGQPIIGNSPADQEMMYSSQASVPTSHSNEQTPGADSAIPNSQWHPHWTDQTNQSQDIQSRISDQRGLMDYLCYDHSLEQGLNGESISSMNWLSPSNEVYENWNAQFTSFIEPIESEASVTSLAVGNATLFQEPLAAWNSEMAMQISAGPLEVPLDNSSNSSSFSNLSNQPGIAPGDGVEFSIGSKATSRYYVDNKGARASVQQLKRKRELMSRRPGSSTSSPQVIIGSAIPTTLPSNQGSQDVQTANPIVWVSVDLYNELLQKIQLPTGTEHSTVSMASLPSLEHLSMFCQLYFDNFHPGFPLIRKQLFSVEKDTWLLVLAVAAIGVRYSRADAPETVVFRHVLQSSLRATVESIVSDTTRNGEYVYATTPFKNSSSGDRIVIIQSRILNVLLMIHSGEKALMSTACSEFAALVALCNRMQLLSSIDKKGLIRGNSNGQLWEKRWIQIQLRIRAGYMIWLLDYMFMYEFNQPPQMELSDAQAPLPCSQEAMEKPSWNISTSQFETSSLVEAMDALYTEKRLIPNVSEFGRILLVHAICRQTTEFYRYSRNRMSAWMPSASVQSDVEFVPTEIWPPSSPTISKWRNSACDSLDILHWSANSKAAQLAGFEHPTILHLHLARLIILTPLAHIQDLADLDEWKFEAHPSAATFTFAPDKIKATRQVLQWAIRDQYKARLSIIHAAAIFWYIRRYSCDSFIEPFAVYTSTLVIWAYSVSMQLSKRQENFRSINLASQRNGFDVDGTSNQLEVTSSSAAQSEEESDPDPSFIHIDRPCDDESVQMYMRLGHKVTANMSRIGDIRADGAPKKILLEGIRILSDGAIFLGADSSGNGQVDHATEFACTWGITRSYVYSLRGLVRAIDSSEQRKE